MIEPSNGLIILYNYLWAREHDRHEQTGRKARPDGVQIMVARGKSGTVVALFPIASQPPQPDRTALEIPEIEARRVGLTIPSWIMVDEWNLDNLAKSPHIGDPHPLGTLSPVFMKRLRAEAAARIRTGRYRSMPRRY
jgi:hypothetical protein